MHLACEDCGQPIQAEDLDLETLVARCRACNAVFSFAGKVGADVPARGRRVSETDAPRPPVPMPSGIVAEERPGSLRLIRSWFSTKLFFLAFFCVFWDGFLVFWYSTAFRTGAPWFFKAFPALHVAVGIGLTYSTLAGFINKTVIDVGQGVLCLRHGPLPWPGNRSLAAGDLSQLFCEEKTNRGRDGTYTSYAMNAQLRNGKRLQLIAGLDEKGQALFLEQKIESRLGIQDRPVGGELPR